MSMFQKATKRAVRARIAFDGPSGSGKTWTSLEWARKLGAKIALVDTERGSASLYADHFNFDVLEISPPFHPDRLVEAIRGAEAEHYDVMIIDSLSHFWEGEGGVLDIADAAGARAQGNSWAGWKSATPVLRHLVDVMLASDLHVLVTMRSKTEWTQEEYTDKDGRKKTKPTRVGMAPVMRAGMEYEFTVVGDLDLEHRLTITKSRCDALSDLVVQPGRAHEAAETFLNWTQTGAELASRNDIDLLKAAMDKIEPKDVRVAAKRAFIEAFGNPDYLIADKLDDARALISGYEGTSPTVEASQTTRTGEGEPHTPAESPGQGAPLPDTAEDSGSEEHTDPEPEAKPSRAWTIPQRIHIEARRLNITDADLDVIILNCTKGRTDSANDLDQDESARVRIAMGQWADGTLDQTATRLAVGDFLEKQEKVEAS